ncbi:Dync1li1, partial [Symbiodinium microadriaticum]
ARDPELEEAKQGQDFNCSAACSVLILEDVVHERLLLSRLKPMALQLCAAIICLDLKTPWTMLEDLRSWLEVLKRVVGELMQQLPLEEQDRLREQVSDELAAYANTELAQGEESQESEGKERAGGVASLTYNFGMPVIVAGRDPRRHCERLGVSKVRALAKRLRELHGKAQQLHLACTQQEFSVSLRRRRRSLILNIISGFLTVLLAQAKRLAPIAPQLTDVRSAPEVHLHQHNPPLQPELRFQELHVHGEDSAAGTKDQSGANISQRRPQGEGWSEEQCGRSVHQLPRQMSLTAGQSMKKESRKMRLDAYLAAQVADQKHLKGQVIQDNAIFADRVEGECADLSRTGEDALDADAEPPLPPPKLPPALPSESSSEEGLITSECQKKLIKALACRQQDSAAQICVQNAECEKIMRCHFMVLWLQPTSPVVVDGSTFFSKWTPLRTAAELKDSNRQCVFQKVKAHMRETDDTSIDHDPDTPCFYDAGGARRVFSKESYFLNRLFVGWRFEHEFVRRDVIFVFDFAAVKTQALGLQHIGLIVFAKTPAKAQDSPSEAAPDPGDGASAPPSEVEALPGCDLWFPFSSAELREKQCIHSVMKVFEIAIRSIERVPFASSNSDKIASQAEWAALEAHHDLQKVTVDGRVLACTSSETAVEEEHIITNINGGADFTTLVLDMSSFAPQQVADAYFELADIPKERLKKV